MGCTAARRYVIDDLLNIGWDFRYSRDLLKSSRAQRTHQNSTSNRVSSERKAGFGVHVRDLEVFACSSAAVSGQEQWPRSSTIKLMITVLEILSLSGAAIGNCR